MLQSRNKRRPEEESPGPQVKTRRIPPPMQVAGRLVQVELENFMCHGNLKVNFDVENHNCIYIGGPNGSGKSALFAAINLGLGGVGRSNDRGNSVKMYIKTGKSRAKTRITLTNTGEGSFSEFGDRIIVDRTINETGGSYAVKTVRGNTEVSIPGGKGTLNKIISRFGIELNNPIYWLSQDRARKFLADTNPKQLFQIFADASEFDSTIANYNVIATHMNAINTNLFNVEAHLRQLREEYRKKQAYYTRLQKEASLVKEITVLHWMSYFSPLRDIEEEEQLIQTKITENRTTFRKLKQQHKDQAVELKDWRTQLEELAEKTSEQRGQVDAMERHLADYEDKMLPYKDEMKELNRKICKIDQDIEQSNATINDAEKKIQIEKQKLAKNEDRRRIEDLEKKMAEMDELSETNKEELAKLDKNREKITQHLRETKAEAYESSNKYQQLHAECNEMAKEVGYIKQSAENHLARFGRDVPQIVLKINEQGHRFDVKPKGPIGSYIKVNDKKYQLAAEQALRRQLGCFIVASRKDEELFKRLMQHFRIPCPPIIVAKMGQAPHDTRENEPPSQYMTVMKMIEVSDNDVRNSLIDLAGIESIILFDNDQQAREIMNGKAPPRCSTAYTCSGAEVHGNDGRSNTQYRFYACNQRHASMLADSSTNNLDELNRQLDFCRRQFEIARETAKQKNSRFEEVKRQYQQAEKKREDIEDKQRRYQNEIHRYKREVASITDREDGNVLIGAQQRLLQEMQDAKAGLLQKREGMEHELEKKRKVFAKMEQSRKEFQVEAEGHAKEIEGTDSTAEGLRMKIQHLSGKIQDCEVQMKQLESKIKKFEEEDLIDLMKRKDDAMEKLQSEDVKTPPGCEQRPDYANIPETRTLLTMMKKKQAELSGVQEELGEAPSEQGLKVIQDKFNNGKMSYNSLKQINQALQTTLELRKKKFPVLRHCLISKVKDAFQNLISYKFEGEMKINTERREISILIKPHSSNPNEKLKDIRGLSGGEKSYTTTCFLMALWEIMETPFRCMDEFDVFMDGHMRKTAMELIVKEATQKYKHQQFIFFTPQGINEIKKANEDHVVATFEMPKVRD